MDEQARPARAYEMILKLGADSMEELLRALRSLPFDLERGDPPIDRNYEAVSGGPSSSYMLSIIHTPGMTHDAYVEQVRQWLANRKSTADE